jgi:hypothetical protein
MTQYNFCPEGSDTPELIESEQWKWIAVYNDGTSLSQFDDTDKSFHQFKEIDQTKLASFMMVCDNRPAVTLLFLPGMKLIHFYRNIHLDMGGADVYVKLYCFGYERNGMKVITVIMPNNSVVIVDDVNQIGVQL